LDDSGFIDLHFGDESHSGLTPNLPYAWQTKENLILLPASKGRFLNVVGLINRKKNYSLIYLKLLSIPTNSFVLWTLLLRRRLKKQL